MTLGTAEQTGEPGRRARPLMVQVPFPRLCKNILKMGTKNVFVYVFDGGVLCCDWLIGGGNRTCVTFTDHCVVLLSVIAYKYLTICFHCMNGNS